MTKKTITVKELKKLLAEYSDDDIITLTAYGESDETGDYGVAELEADDKYLLTTY